MKTTGAVLALMVAAASLSGCAAPARTDRMVAVASHVPAAAPESAAYRTFRVAKVEGGSKTNPMWMSNVDGVAFQAALEQSLKAANYLADDPAQAKAEITANLVNLDRPIAGLDLTVTTTVQYRAVRIADASVIFDDKVAATGTAHFSDNFVAVERLRLANEAAVRENIEAFMKRLDASVGK